MKRLFTLLVLLAWSCVATAAYVDILKASKVAETILPDAALSLLPMNPFGNMYLFNGEHGFVIVASDDCAKPVLAYSEDFPFCVENMPDNLRYWLQSLDDEIQYAIDMKLEATDETRRDWELLLQGRKPAPKHRTEVQPLIKTHWDQEAPFNNLCPEDTPAGCIATAMAQIMKYWEWPDRGVGSHSYDHAVYGTLSADFGNTLYDWDLIPINVSFASSEEQQLAVATLVYHCGVSVDMNYNPGGSGAGAYPASVAFTSYFDYDPSSLQYLRASDYDDESWVSLLKTELDNRRPVLYSGYSDESGHAFICDGYDANDYFHFNIGWSGLGDGYYAYGAINLAGVPTGPFAYNKGNVIIAGIQPKEHALAKPENLSVLVSGRNLTLSWSPVTNAHHYKLYDNGIIINNNIIDNSYSLSNVPYGCHTCCVKAVNADGCCSERSEEIVAEVLFEGPVPNDVIAEVQDHDVSLRWTAPVSETAQLKYGNGMPDSYYYGNAPGRGFYWGQRFTPEQLAPYAGMAVSSVGFYVGVRADYKVFIFKEVGDELEQLAVQDYTANSTGWKTVQLATPVAIDYTNNLIVLFYNDTDNYVAAYIEGDDFEDSNARLCTNDCLYWITFSFNMSWLIRTNITDGTYTYSIYRDEQEIATNVTCTSYVDAALPDGYYQYSVRTQYYGGLSNPSDMASAIVGSVDLVSVSVNPPGSGNVAGSGYYVPGNTVTLSASPVQGYLFDCWTENGVLVSTSPDYSFVADGDRSLIAEFRDNDLNINELIVVDPTCNGGDDGAVTIEVSGGASPYIFEFEGQSLPVSGSSYTFSNLSAGFYSVRVMDSTGYEVVSNAELVEPEALTAGMIKSGSETVGVGQSCSTIQSIQDAFSGQSAMAYRWKKNGKVIGNSDSSQYTPEILPVGSYAFTREVKDACTEWIPSVGTWTVVVQQTDVEENAASRLEVYPNPTRDKVTVRYEDMEYITVTAVTGQQIATTLVNGDQADVDLTDVRPGVYVLMIHTCDGANCFIRILKH